jgi:catechol 2,3-dioxygenase-like lactoylglutathione lyase family enzyme
MPKISGITHWSLGARDLAEAERFYTDVVGLEPRGRLNPRMSCFGVGEINILLCECQVPAPPEDNVVHHSFTLEPAEWERAAKHLADNAITPELIYRERGYFPGRELYFADPSGNRLEFRDPTWRPGMPKPGYEELVARQPG